MERSSPSQSDGLKRRALITTAAAAGVGVWERRAGGLLSVSVGYLRWLERRPTISLLDKQPADDGLAGARLAIDDNNTTGRFINQQFSLEDVRLGGDADAVAVTIALAERGVSLVIADLPADALLKAADAGAARKLLFFNVGAI